MARRSPAERNTKERILAAALEVFGDRGYRDASIDEIAARAGVTKGAIYYYFVDKDDLARDLQRTLWEKLSAEAMRALDLTKSIVENLERSFDAYLYALQGLGVARFFLRDTYLIASLDGAARDERDTHTEPLRAMLKVGIDRGELLPLDPEASARMLVGAFSEATLHVLTTGDPEPARAVVKRFVESLAVSKRKGEHTRPKRAPSKASR